MKRVFDIVVSLAGPVLLFPLVLFVAVVIKADSPGPISLPHNGHPNALPNREYADKLDSFLRAEILKK